MDLAVISYPTPFDGETTTLRHLFDSGLDHFHLRKYGFDEAAMRMYLDAIPTEFRKHVMLHSHHHLALEYELMGIHFSKHTPHIDKPLDGLQRSISCHSLKEIIEMPDDIDYCFLSPIFDSISKPDHKSGFSDQGDLWEFLSDSDGVEIYALGGINANNIATAANLGFYGAATLGAVWNPAATLGKHLETVTNFNAILKQCQTVLTH